MWPAEATLQPASTTAAVGAGRPPSPARFRRVTKPSTCVFSIRWPRRAVRSASPESRRRAAVRPGARDHGFVAACRACRVAGQRPGQRRRADRRTGLSGPRGPSGPGMPPGRGQDRLRRRVAVHGAQAPPQVTIAQQPTTPAAPSQRIRRRRRRPDRGRSPGRRRGVEPALRPNHVRRHQTPLSQPTAPFHQPSRAAASLTAGGSPPRRTRASDRGRPPPRHPGEIDLGFRTRGLITVLFP